MAMRLRSRQVTWTMGSTPACLAMSAPAMLDRRTTAVWLSVTLAASTKPARAAALRRTTSPSALLGGPISAVTANWPDCSRASRAESVFIGRACPAALPLRGRACAWGQKRSSHVPIGQAGVDGEDGAGDLGRAVGGEEQRRLGHVGGRDVELERAALAVDLGQLVHAHPPAGGAGLAPLSGPQAAALEDGVGGQAVDADTERPGLLGNAAGQVQ